MEIYGDELSLIEYLDGLDLYTKEGEEYLKERLKTIKNGWRDYKLMRYWIDRVTKNIYDTLPVDVLRYLQVFLPNSEVIIRPKPATRSSDAQIVPLNDIAFLINKVMENECAICLNEGVNAKKCELRKILNHICGTKTRFVGKRCPYADEALKNDLGGYLKV